jgi:hypothetical protein
MDQSTSNLHGEGRPSSSPCIRELRTPRSIARWMALKLTTWFGTNPPLWSPTLRGWLARLLFRLAWKSIQAPIPGDELLWRSVWRPDDQLKEDGTLKHGFFRDKDGVSCDLARFSTVERSRRGYGMPPPWPHESGLTEFDANLVRENGSDVRHDPDTETNNYAHAKFTATLTTGQAKALAKRVKFRVPHRFPSRRA